MSKQRSCKVEAAAGVSIEQQVGIAVALKLVFGRHQPIDEKRGTGAYPLER